MDKMLIFKRELMAQKYAANTVEVYCSCLKILLEKFGEHPSTDAVKDFLITIKNRNYHAQFVATIRHYFKYVIKSPISLQEIPYPRKEEKIPEILSQQEMAALISYPKNLKHQAIICTLYGTGMRVGELINLKLTDIDSNRMVITIRGGKGNKDRQVMLDPGLLLLLREYVKKYSPKEYLFNGQFTNQYSDRSVGQLLKYWAKKAGIKKRIHPHLMRHSFATHLLESGTDMSIIQKLLGHKKIETTEIYAKLSTSLISKVKSPLQNISL